MMEVSERLLRMFEFFIAKTYCIVELSVFMLGLDVTEERGGGEGRLSRRRVINCRFVLFNRRRRRAAVVNVV